MKVVLQKFIAESGLCSRRSAEELIRKGRVTINEKMAKLGIRVDGTDEIKINGKKIPLAKEKIYIILNKPKGYVCTNKKFVGEKNIFDLINIKEKLFTVGRLDKDSHGLVLLTNDGETAQKLAHPKFEHEKKYIVETQNFTSLQNNVIKRFKTGVEIGEGDGIVKAKNAKYLGDNKFEIILTEGRKRQIRRMFKTVDIEVIDLVRTEIGSLQLGKLPTGKWRHLKNEEIKLIK